MSTAPALPRSSRVASSTSRRSERHGRPIQLFWTWMSPNFEFATVYVGVLPIVLFGGGFWLTVVGLVLGTALGAVTHGWLSTFGPRYGVPQLIQSRAAFGYVGNLVPAFLNTLTSGAGWVAVNSVSGAFAVQTFFNHVGLERAALLARARRRGGDRGGHRLRRLQHGPPVRARHLPVPRAGVRRLLPVHLRPHQPGPRLQRRRPRPPPVGRSAPSSSRCSSRTRTR